MPNNSSFADTVLDADQLLAAVAANADLLPAVEKHRAPLAQAVAELKELSVRQKTLTADKQQVTQDLNATMRRVKDLVLHLRAAVRSDIGPRSEKLVEFKVAPLRPRSRKARPVPAEPTAATPTP
jgi:hypothetical protein